MDAQSESLMKAFEHHRAGDLETADNLYRQILRIDPQHASALRMLGMLAFERQAYLASVGWLHRAVGVNKADSQLHKQLGRALLKLGRLDEASVSFQQALEIEPEDAQTLNQLACLQYRQGRLPEAAACFQQSIEADPRNISSWQNLGSAYVASRQLADAEQCFEQVIEIDPDNTDGWLNLSNVLKTQHRVDEAARAYRRALRLLPDQPLADLWLATLCPSVFQSHSEIESYRAGLQGDIERISSRELKLEIGEFGAEASAPPVNLQYQGHDDRELLEAFAGIFGGCFTIDPPQRVRRDKPRIGFVVTSGHEAIFLRYLGGVLQRLSPEKFQLVVACPETSASYLRTELKSDAIRLLPMPYEFDQAVETIRAAQFDVLYHWETGTDVTDYFLPFCRLAPVQCTSLGNSGTSGIKQIDYFLSSDLFEPEEAGAGRHYTEELLLLRGLCSFQRRVSLPEPRKNRADFGYTADQHIYLCAQKPQKIHPDFDPILADILRRDERGVLVLVEDAYGVAAELLRRRFWAGMADVAERVVFETQLGFSDYLCLLAEADVLLDSPHYGGGVTMYDTLSLNRPVVTLPLEQARSRYALGFYRQMGISTPVASSPQEYVEIALRLATEPDFRRSAEREIENTSSVIFENDDVVAEYERVLEQLADEARSK